MGYGPDNVLTTLKITFNAVKSWDDDMRRAKYVELVWKLRKWLRFFDEDSTLLTNLSKTNRFHAYFHVYIPNIANMMPRIDQHLRLAFQRKTFFPCIFIYFLNFSSTVPATCTPIYISYTTPSTICRHGLIKPF